MSGPRSPRRRSPCLALLGVCLLVAGTFTHSASAGDPTRRDVAVESEGIESLDLDPTLRELFARNRLELVRGPIGTVPFARVVVRRREKSIEVTVLRGGETFVREIEADKSAAVLREVVAHVVLSLVDPDAEADPIAMAAPKAKEPVAENPEPSPPKKETEKSLEVVRDEAPLPKEAKDSREAAPGPSPHGLSFAMGIHGGPMLSVDSEAGVSVLLAARLTHESNFRPSIALEGGASLPVDVRRADVEATFGAIPLRVRAGIEPLAAKRVSLEVGLTAGVEVQTLHAADATISSRPRTSNTRLEPIAGPFATMRLRTSPTVDVAITAGAEVDAVTRKWLVEPGHGVVAESARIRPYVLVGFEWTLAGTAHARTGGLE